MTGIPQAPPVLRGRRVHRIHWVLGTDLLCAVCHCGAEQLFDDPVVLGVALGLVVGKTVGVFLASFAAIKLGLGRLPTGATWRPGDGVSAPLPPGRLRRMLERYDAELVTTEGVPVTYELIEVCGNRPIKPT